MFYNDPIVEERRFVVKTEGIAHFVCMYSRRQKSCPRVYIQLCMRLFTG